MNSNQLYNIKIYQGTVLKQTILLNAPYGVCVARRKVIMANGIAKKNIHISKAK